MTSPISADVPPDQPLDADGLLAARLIEAAHRRVRAVLPPTPLHLSERRGAWLKLESLQVTGAYKVRGALNALAAQIERGDRRPVFAASAGNHGLGVAWAARRLGLEATVVVPSGAPAGKVDGCRRLGARVVDGGQTIESCAALAARRAREAGGRFVHPFDDPEVIAGQATIALELLEARPDVVVVPVGGGGLAAGVGTVLRRRGVRVVGVQVAGADGLRRALLGEALHIAGPTIADGIRVATPGALSGRLCAAVLESVLVVEEDEVLTALASLALDDKLVAEGAGAVAVAALPRVRGERPIAVVSGGNVDPAVLVDAGMTRSSAISRGQP
jgi:threonine dehydratase